MSTKQRREFEQGICSDLPEGIPTMVSLDALGVSRSTYYKRRKTEGIERMERPTPVNKLSQEEDKKILSVMGSDEFKDMTIDEVRTTLLDENVYLASRATMYRKLKAVGQTKERRNQAKHPVREVPVLKATGPNQVWCWDITKLRAQPKSPAYSKGV
jgi:putative transposase